MSSNSSIIKNENAFSVDFIPEKILFRESQIKEIVDAIKTKTNLFVYGPPSVGKTMSIKYVIKELENAYYVNCWVNGTKYLIVKEIASNAGLKFLDGKSSDHIILSLKKNIEDGVFIFDEIDKAKNLSFLYQFSELFPKSSIILISNSMDILNRIEPRILSRLTLRHLLFQKYNKEQIYNILKQRVKYGLKPNSIDNTIIKIISQFTLKTDLRRGIKVLHFAAKRAKNKIEMEDVREAVKIFKEESPIDEEDKMIISCIKKEMTSGKLFKEYVKKGGKLSYRSFKRHLDLLAKKGKIAMKFTGAGFKGRSNLISLPKEINEII